MLRVVGDVHGKQDEHVELVKNSSHSLQIGDMGFHYEKLLPLDSNNHKFFGGNHDNYDIYEHNPHALGHYGVEQLGGEEFYYIRGGFSIDAKSRLVQEELYGVKSWWSKEQLNDGQMEKAYQGYKEYCPQVMISHTCPKQVVDIISNPAVLKMFGFDPKTFNTRTQQLLDECMNIHQPDIWIFGHFHRTLDFEYRGTRFLCLGELRYLDLNGDQIIYTNKLDRVNQC